MVVNLFGALRPIVAVMALIALLLPIASQTLASQASDRQAADNVKILFVIGSGDSELRDGIIQAITAFERDHPTISVEPVFRESEFVKANIDSILTERSYDIVQWFAARALHNKVDQGMVADISHLRDSLADLSPSALDAASHKGKLYAVPFTYYEWGLWYSTAVLQSLNRTPPQNWDEFVAMMEQLKGKPDMEAIAIGSKDVWPLGGWFDYINLRLHGPEFHYALLDGQISFLDPRVKDLFTMFTQTADYFNDDHRQMEWRDSAILVKRGKAGVALYGSFFLSEVQGNLANRVVFAPFPTITDGVKRAEEAPTDVFLIPANAVSPEAAAVVLTHFSKAEIQQTLLRGTGQLATHSNSPMATDPTRQTAITMLQKADVLTQYLDRDIHPGLLEVMMGALAEISEFPEKLPSALLRLEEARKGLTGQDEGRSQ